VARTIPLPTKTLTQQLKDRRLTPGKKTPGVLPTLHSSGSTLLNLACADSTDGAYPIGSVVNIVGDKSAGKTILVLSGLAEVAANKERDKTCLVYDDAEAAMGFDLARLFGERAKKRIELPEPVSTIEGYTDRIHDLLEKGKRFIHVLDSFDMIGAEADAAKYDLAREARAGKREKGKGSYGMGRAKGSSELFRLKKKAIRDSGGLLVVVSQVRENLDASGPWSPKFVRAGGKALDHNAQLVCWLAAVKQLKKKVRGKDHIIGQLVEAKVTKNKVTGKLRTVRFPVFYDYGVDDIGSMVDFLVEEEWWKKTGNKIQTDPAMDLTPMDRADLLSAIESLGLESSLKNATQECWNQIEATLAINRKRRYE